MTTTRRRFLKSSAAATATLLVSPRLVLGTERPAKTLVIVQLAGGNDSLNTLVPYSDARYRKLRPSLALNEGELLHIDEHFALHPALAPVIPLVEQKKIALIDGVGFASLDRSHFRSQDVWQTADEGCGRDHRRRLGWVGRYADRYLGAAESPLVTLAIGNQAPLGMSVDHRRATVIPELSRFLLPRGSAADDAVAALRDIYGIRRENDALTEAIRAFGEDMFRALAVTAAAPARPAKVTYPTSRLGEALRAVAFMIATHPEVQFAWVTIGGYDTHAKQSGEHAALLADLASSLATFQVDLETRKIDDRVLLMAWSEFGRRAAENASGGTDHGKAGLVLTMGSGVRGGLFGAPPDLARLDNGDLPSRIDFRSVYATVIRDWLGRDPEPVLGRTYPPLGFLGS